MSFNIQNFRQQLPKGPALQTYFRVLFSGPLFRSHQIEAMAFICNQATIPGRLVDASDVFTYGPRRRQAHRNFYDDLQLSFFCRDEDMFPRPLFEEWQNGMVESGSNIVNYYNNYACDIEIQQLNAQGEEIYSLRIFDAFPTNVNPLSLDWSARDTPHNLSVVFSIRKMQELHIPWAPFGNWLSINQLYPNFDLGGSLDKLAMSVINRDGVQTVKRWQRGEAFADNLTNIGLG